MSSSDIRPAAAAIPADPASLAPSGGPAPRGAAWRRVAALDPGVQLARVGVLVAALLIWTLAVERGWVLRLYAATPLQTWDRLVRLLGSSTFWGNLAVTLQETLAGWVIGASLGLASGLVLGRWRRGAKVMDPYLTFVNATPKIALAPFFILWFGIGANSKIVLAAIIVFFIVQVPTQAAVSLVPADLDLVATTMGATELQKFRKVVLPGIMAAVFGALRLAAVYALLAVVLGEFIAAQRGLGQALITATNQFDMATAFALLIILAVLAVGLNSLIGLFERRFLRWRTWEARGQTTGSPL
jgi:NitT/TauT family transport system permease protein